jgi:hypothetical protein
MFAVILNEVKDLSVVLKYKILHGVYPDRNSEILRFAQNDAKGPE